MGIDPIRENTFLLDLQKGIDVRSHRFGGKVLGVLGVNEQAG